MPSDSLAIRVRGIGRYFGPRVEIDGAANPREALRTLLRIGGIRLRPSDRDPQVTMAAAGHVLRDVSFDVARGAVVCLTGPSGSGKSVLLQILAGAVVPSTGSIEIYGSLSHLLSIGGTVDARSTADDVIASADLIDGASPEEAARFRADVIEFAELEGFERAPIRTYSTGMVMRLGVALALCGSPSVVLIDDVLTVGDIAFQQKCVDRVHALKEAGATLLLAVSDEELVRQIATRIITLGNGRVVSDTPVERAVAPARTEGAADLEWQVLQILPDDDMVALRSIGVVPEADAERRWLRVDAVFEAKVPGLQCRPLVSVNAAHAVLFRSLYPRFLSPPGTSPLQFSVRIPVDVLPAGAYTIALHMVSQQGSSVYALKANDAVKLTVRRASAPPSDGDQSPSLLWPVGWEIERLQDAPADVPSPQPQAAFD
jgi:ABC-type polysaccharide/polyol phosphate transport system ATPase subunit